MKQILRFALTLAALFAPVAMAATGAGTDYPSRPVRMIVPFAPGGAC